ncbi:protein Ycf2-like [Cucumis melo var. makuwa]|uniref:Protein Ycf2-like n=1 Tax=Cucumis melo var. makuwa TaxID=1194695 RepID=A0A5A7TG38_CUCMM|nr:protein Ycf2-like [Cucumis melo var. makuwa]
MGEGSGSKRESPGTTKKRVRTETKKDEANVQKKQRIKSLVSWTRVYRGKGEGKKQKEIEGKEDTESKSEKEEKVQEDEQDEDKEDEEKQYEEGEGETVVGEDSNSSTSEIPTDTK